MSSWARSTPKKPVVNPPKVDEEFNRLPKALPHQPDRYDNVLPYPPPSRLFQPGTGQRFVDESITSRLPIVDGPAFNPISDAASDPNPQEVKTFPAPTSVRPLQRQRNFLPRVPEPFVGLTKNTYGAKNVIQNNNEVVKTFEPAFKPIAMKGKPVGQYIRSEPKTKSNAAAVARKNVSQLGLPANPQITIAIPLYNGVEFLEEALQSVKRQTYNEWVGIIGVNGHGATGEPVFSKATEIVYNLGLSQRFQVVNLPDVRGGANAINHMVGQSTTPFIAHLDADDLWLSKKLEYQMSVIDQDNTIGIVGTMCRYFGDSNDFKILPPGLLNIDDFKSFNPLIHSSILIKREFAVYSDEFVAYDYDCWVRNMKNGAVIFNINNILVLHRIHNKSYYNTSGKQDPEAIKRKYGLI